VPKLRLEWAELDLEPGDGVVAGPTWDDVRAIVEHLGRCEGGFVILSRGEQEYIQCARNAGGITVEHRAGSDDAHFTLADGPTDAEDAVGLFRAWFDDPSSIGEHAEWKPMDM
jgi:hypothetical protein